MAEGDRAHVVVIGGGIAGVSAAYFLAAHRSGPAVTLVEAEPQLAHHTTGRSAAQLIENYGSLPTRAVTAASLDFFRDPPDGLTDRPLLTRRGIVTVATEHQDAQVEAELAAGRDVAGTVEEITPAEAQRLVPVLRADRFARAIHEPDSADIDVAGLHQAFVRGARQLGATISPERRVTDLSSAGAGGAWTVTTEHGPSMPADVVVNAAGAWGDVVAGLAGIAPVGLRPLRRTAFMVNGPDGAPDEPLLAEIAHDWYVKRDGVQYLCSPAEEELSEPTDAKPDELDVAAAIDRINDATTLGIRSVRSAWTGLRTFTPDRTMVLGPDPDHPSFVWCVGQGGTGIQTAPGAGRLVADLTLDGKPGNVFDGVGLDLAAFSAARFDR
ncbi:MAG: FAD-binding oxidoreductase [Actinomycetota bacterium]